MASGVSVQVEGLDKLMAKFGKLPQAIKTNIGGVLIAAAKGFEDRAVNDAPTDQGVLKNSITTKRNGEMNFEVVCSASWAAFIEFGTRKKAQVPANLQAYASQFRGSGGSADGDGFFESILAWVKRKGIVGRYSVKSKRRLGSKAVREDEDKQAAFAIYRSILFNGIKPHPFFFKQMPQAQAEVQRDLNNVIAEALR